MAQTAKGIVWAISSGLVASAPCLQTTLSEQSLVGTVAGAMSSLPSSSSLAPWHHSPSPLVLAHMHQPSSL